MRRRAKRLEMSDGLALRGARRGVWLWLPVATCVAAWSPAWLSAQDAPACYTAIGREVRGLGKAAASGQEKCHQLAQKAGVPGGLCNDVEGVAFTILDGGKYAKTQARAVAKLHDPVKGKCPLPAAATATDILPGDNLANKLPSIAALSTERGQKLLGNAAIGNDAAKKKCFKVISSARRAIADRMMNAALKCQKTKPVGSGLDGSCLDDTVLASFLNGRQTAIQSACTGLTGAQVGSCDPLPDCVIEAALAEGKNLATLAYSSENCTKGTASPNARTATISLQTPTALGGVTVLVRYPRFDAGIEENGNAIDLSRFTSSAQFLDAFDLDDAVRISAVDSWGINSGTLATVKFDVCRPLLPEGTCSITTTQACTENSGCRAPTCSACKPSNKCTGDGTTSCSSDSQCVGNGTCGEKCIARGRSCSVSQFLDCATDADCPATELCLSQRALTTCEVEAASDTSGNPVAGVSCAVVLSEP